MGYSSATSTMSIQMIDADFISKKFSPIQDEINRANGLSRVALLGMSESIRHALLSFDKVEEEYPTLTRAVKRDGPPKQQTFFQALSVLSSAVTFWISTIEFR